MSDGLRGPVVGQRDIVVIVVQAESERDVLPVLGAGSLAAAALGSVRLVVEAVEDAGEAGRSAVRRARSAGVLGRVVAAAEAEEREDRAAEAEGGVMDTRRFELTASPHIKGPDTTPKIMWSVVLSRKV